MILVVLKNPEKLKKDIIIAGYTYAGFSRELGYSRAYISWILSGKRNPNPDISVKICELLRKKFDTYFFIESVHKIEQKAGEWEWKIR